MQLRFWRRRLDPPAPPTPPKAGSQLTLEVFGRRFIRIADGTALDRPEVYVFDGEMLIPPGWIEQPKGL